MAAKEHNTKESDISLKINVDREQQTHLEKTIYIRAPLIYTENLSIKKCLCFQKHIYTIHEYYWSHM